MEAAAIPRLLLTDQASSDRFCAAHKTKLCLGLIRKGFLNRFLTKILFLCIFSLASGLTCLEMVELYGLQDDVSNDYVEVNAILRVDPVNDERVTPSERRPLSTSYFPLFSSISDPKDPLPNQDLLTLISLQRK
jgi:hypothetical protein